MQSMCTRLLVWLWLTGLWVGQGSHMMDPLDVLRARCPTLQTQCHPAREVWTCSVGTWHVVARTQTLCRWEREFNTNSRQLIAEVVFLSSFYMNLESPSISVCLNLKLHLREKGELIVGVCVSYQRRPVLLRCWFEPQSTHDKLEISKNPSVLQCEGSWNGIVNCWQRKRSMYTKRKNISSMMCLTPISMRGMNKIQSMCLCWPFAALHVLTQGIYAEKATSTLALMPKSHVTDDVRRDAWGNHVMVQTGRYYFTYCTSIVCTRASSVQCEHALSKTGEDAQSAPVPEWQIPRDLNLELFGLYILLELHSLWQIMLTLTFPCYILFFE